MSRCGLLLVVISLASLAAAAGASGEPVNAYTATGTPQQVQPSSTATHTISLTNDPLSPMEADKAKIGIPAGFVVSGASVQASASAAGSCAASTWIADGTLIADGKINLKRPSGGGDTGRLCPGATLTVAFSATSSAVEGSYVWTTELIRDTAFLLNGAQPTVAVDGTAPVVTLDSRPSNPSNLASPSFEFSANEAAGFQCKLDAAAFAPCTSPKGYSPGDGHHVFTVKATDAAGNSGEASYGWTIDTVAPVPTLTQKPAKSSNDVSPSFEFSASEAAGFECKLDAAAFAACTSPATYSAGDGAHAFTVKATDAAGNSAETIYDWTIDTVSPIVTITGKPDNPSNVKSPAFEFSTEPGAALQCKLDLGVFSTCASPKTYLNLADGAHEFTVRTTDAAGNSGEATYEWLLETDLPIVTLQQKPNNPSGSASATFAFIATKPSTLQCRLDGGGFAACASPMTFNGLPDGSHTFAVKAKDTAGNTGPDTVYGWTIDTVAPAAAITEKPSDPTNSRSAAFSFTASEPGGGFQCRLDGAAFAACASPQVYSGLPDGRHTFAVRATDALANVGAEIAYAWTIENRAPAVTLTSVPSSLSNSTSASVAFSADEPATFQCRLDDRAFEPCSSPAPYAGLRDGGHAFSVRATDAAGNVGSGSYSWRVDATAPETVLKSRPAGKTTATSARFSFSGRGSSTFECRLDSGSFARCVSPRSYRRVAAGSHRFVVRAVDAAGNVDPTPSRAVWRVTRGGASRTAANAALLAPAPGARVKRPPLLRWRAVRGATYYNVQIFRSGRKVLSAWPTRTRLQLQSEWRFGGQKVQLSAGRYQWYVWPGYGRPSSRRYGRLLGNSTFVVGRPAARR